MKVVQVPRRFVRSDWGGTETVVLETCKRLPGLGVETEVLCPNALAQSDEELMEGVHVRRVPYFYPYWGLTAEARRRMDRKGGNMFSFPLMRALRDMPGLDLIHLHTGKRIGGIARWAAKKRGIPYIVSLHGGVHDVPAAEAATWTEPTKGAFEWGRALGYWVGSHLTLAEADAILCVGKTEQEETQKRYPGRRVLHLPNGVDTKRFAVGDGAKFRAGHGIPQDAYLVGAVGRLDVQKNQLFAVRALPEMRRIQPTAHLLLVGHVTNEQYAQQVRQEIATLGLQEHVTLLAGLDGSSRELVDAYHALDLCILTSTHEPFGIVLLEAWAAGKPILASRVGGVPSFVVHERNGLLFSSNELPSFLTSFRACIETPELARRIAAAGHAAACEEYDWDRITERLVALYSEIVGKRK